MTSPLVATAASLMTVSMCAGVLAGGPVLYTNDFDDDALGIYTRAELDADWNDPPWRNGVDQDRVSIVESIDRPGRSMRVLYPEGGVGPGTSGGGAQWRLELDASYDELYCAYRVRFGDGFDFVLGGKLPGLVGGEANTGGNPPDGTDGWSARSMWRTAGKVVQYVYHPDQPGTFGEDMDWDLGGQRFYTPGVWHHVEHRVVMNTPGQFDGRIQTWFDGVLALDATGIRFRDVDTFAIDALYFSTFFGGGSPEWAPIKDETVDFDDFVISQCPIGRCSGDVDRSGSVGFEDVLAVIAAWGSTGGACVEADVNGDGEVSFVDVLTVIGRWGEC